MYKSQLENKKESLKGILSKIKMVDSGWKPPARKAEFIKEPSDTNYPTIFLSAKNAPFLRGCEVGGSVTMVVKAEVVGHDSSKHRDTSIPRDDYRLEVKEMGLVDYSAGK